jgi:hypothetical protein
MAPLDPERHHLMLVHSMLPLSTVNGPGERAVVWLQGCDLRCAGCWNPSGHIFDTGHDRRCDLNRKKATALYASLLLMHQGWGCFCLSRARNTLNRCLHGSALHLRNVRLSKSSWQTAQGCR